MHIRNAIAKVLEIEEILVDPKKPSVIRVQELLQHVMTAVPHQDWIFQTVGTGYPGLHSAIAEDSIPDEIVLWFKDSYLPFLTKLTGENFEFREERRIKGEHNHKNLVRQIYFYLSAEGAEIYPKDVWIFMHGCMMDINQPFARSVRYEFLEIPEYSEPTNRLSMTRALEQPFKWRQFQEFIQTLRKENRFGDLGKSWKQLLLECFEGREAPGTVFEIYSDLEEMVSDFTNPNQGLVTSFIHELNSPLTETGQHAMIVTHAGERISAAEVADCILGRLKNMNVSVRK